MCTVTYLPTSDQEFILTSSRDEQPDRKTAALLQKERIDTNTLLFPRDEQAGGTWITASKRATLCLLNGAFVPHPRKLPYRHSRGLIVLHYFDYPSTEAFIEDYAFTGLEAFTLIIREEGKLWELRWDEKSLFKQELEPDKPHLWASATLYATEVVAKRKQWFAGWLAQNTLYQVEAIRAFHRTAGEGDPQNDLFMQRVDVQTVSLTSIVKRASSVEVWYEAFNGSTSSRITTQTLPILHSSFSS